MRKCGAPRVPTADAPAQNWICPACGNENYPNRLFCNMKKCQLAKPGLTADEVRQAMSNKTEHNFDHPHPPFRRPPMSGRRMSGTSRSLRIF